MFGQFGSTQMSVAIRLCLTDFLGGFWALKGVNYPTISRTLLHCVHLLFFDLVFEVLDLQDSLIFLDTFWSRTNWNCG